jgi:hypothetical protein
MTTQPLNRDVTDAMIALIPEDGSRLANQELRAAINNELGIALSDEEFNASKDVVVAMGLAEKVKGPGGGLKAAGKKQVQARSEASSSFSPDGPLTLSQLEAHLWEAANILRGSPVDRTDWKSYILPLLFFKRICDQWDEEKPPCSPSTARTLLTSTAFSCPRAPTGTMCAPRPRTSAQP